MGDEGAKASLLCLVFTDLVGSTALKSRLGDAAGGERIARYQAEVRRLVSAAGGREIDAAGDGFFLTFAAPSAAVAFALRLQLIHHEDAELPPVRVGLHLGEVTERAAPTGSSKPMLVEGLAVDLASRVEGLATPGQVLMTQAVFDTVRQRLESAEFQREVAWRAHGAYLLEGIDDPLEIGEAGFEGISPLAAPPDSEKARRAVAAGDEATLGWRPAVGLAIPGRAHWWLQEPLGTGAIGEVWLAQHASTHARRVFKFCFQVESLRSLKREVVLLRLLKESLGERPDIAQVIDWQFDEPPYFFETEHSEAGSLVDWGRGQGGIEKVSLTTRLDIVARIADALEAAHRAGVLHKDLKPANVLIYQDEEGKPHVCLTDFGIGLVTRREALEGAGVTVAGLTEALLSSGTSTGAGTRLYMAPEVTEGQQATPLSDVYSLGVILYQIVTGDFGHALATGWERDVEDPLLREDIAACVDGDPSKRLTGPEELARCLRTLPERRATLRAAGSRRRRLIGAAVAVVLALLAVAGWRGWQLWSKARWARDTAVPEIMRLAQAEDFPAAFALATEVERAVGADPRLEPIWQWISIPVTLSTEPPGATVSYKPYTHVEREWTSLGSTPIEQARVPFGVLRWRIEKPGYEPRELAFRAPFISPGTPFWSWTPSFKLDPEGTVPEGMIPVEGGRFGTVSLTGFPPTLSVDLERFYIGRTEVTNAEFQEFVDADGYARREFWKHPFSRDGRTLSLDEAMAHFVDSTGRPGPSTWTLGEYPKGQADYPVAGVSWFEAAAYAGFRGQSLPTIYHWAAAALSASERVEPLSNALLPLSNVEGKGPEPVATRPAISFAGAYDMAGNVCEWVWNAAGNGRYLLGAAWTDPSYRFTDANAESPWERRSTYGIRLATYPEGEPDEALRAAVELPDPDFYAIEPLSEDAVQILQDLASYDAAPLNAVVESTRELPGGGREERVTVDSPSPGERLILYVYPPEDAEPPYQAVIWFPGSNMLFERKTRGYVEWLSGDLGFVRKSGRMLVIPVYAGSFERNDGRTQRRWSQYNSRRALIFEWIREMGRTLDYLAARGDFDGDRVAYLGLSLGAVLGPFFSAFEPRLDALLLWSGGLPAYSPPRQTTDLVTTLYRTTVPVLMLNGRYDFSFPVDTHQRPFFDLLGTPVAEKRHVLFESGHLHFPRGELIRENLAWLDRHLGPVVASEGQVRSR